MPHGVKGMMGYKLASEQTNGLWVNGKDLLA